ncbi:aspartic peptidase domain superfamily [Holotrichia oblita]|uniref:Aspartic peptidase domain superfamily n=1 Tax=Holotrichia oblita TaxID=644536 RepID=A0ACB9SV37_HOLOL|nr:aspartic peptidase domain superfamily [Holotrichia oblita]
MCNHQPVRNYAKCKCTIGRSNSTFTYMVDSGADWSVIHHHVVKSVGAVIIPSQQKFAGLGKELQASGRCVLYVVLQGITLEIDFLVIPDGTILGVEALIGWETISQPGIKIVVRKHGLDLQHSEAKPQFRIIYLDVFPTDGLPIFKRERGIKDDLIAGKDFLNVLMDVPALRKTEMTTIPPQPLVTLPTSIQLENYSATSETVSRETRSTQFTSSILKPASYEVNPTQPLNKHSTLGAYKTSDMDNRRLVSVSISSSVSETHRIYSPRTSSTTEMMEVLPSNTYRSDFFSSESEQSFVAEANRQEFGIEESEPIIKNTDTSIIEELPANVQAIPVIKKLSDFEKTSSLLKELSKEKLKDKLPPFHHTVIYHDSRNEKMAPRSLSYSTVIQTVPEGISVKNWKNPIWKKSQEESKWENLETSTKEHIEPTEINWGMQQRSYIVKQNMAGTYSNPEENYEVDEAVSVQTNGKIHGIQPSQTTGEEIQKPTAKSKNGYVIEGRKERRYRVEERTSDGFIVGEFGIVNRDDGLLRGVRYTAEETINPKIIYDTLMKFLSL